MSGDIIKPEVYSLDDKIAECIKQEDPRFLSRFTGVIAATKQALHKRKTLIYVEGPMGSGKTTLAGIFAFHLGFPCFQEDAEMPEIKQYLQMLYSSNLEMRRVGAEGVNMAYTAHRMRQYSEALMMASTCILDRHPSLDDAYMEMFVEDPDKLMTEEQMKWIQGARNRQIKVLTPTGPTAPLFVIVQIIGSPETFFQMKNGRNRPEEEGVPLSYIGKLTKKYESLPEVTYKSGLRCPIYQITQDLNPAKKFHPEDSRYLVPIFEEITKYVTNKRFG